MSRPKLPRKSTTIDMTAMCDVAFLLLSFFILATQFKPAEVVNILTPTSVASKLAPEKDIVLISISKEGKVFLSMDEKTKKEGVINAVNTNNKLGLTDAEVQALKGQEIMGTPLSQLKQQAKLPKEQIMGTTLPGIPVDSANNQMMQWMQAVVSTYQGSKLNLILKGDNLAKYPSFKNILEAFKKNGQFRFEMVTNPEAVPVGTDLWKNNMNRKPAA